MMVKVEWYCLYYLFCSHSKRNQEYDIVDDDSDY